MKKQSHARPSRPTAIRPAPPSAIRTARPSATAGTDPWVCPLPAKATSVAFIAATVATFALALALAPAHARDAHPPARASAAGKPAAHTAAKDAWIPALPNGLYQNPVLNADYSDPDVIRHGEMYYMTSSSFNSTPGLPLLQSRDMVNWELVGHALPQQVPLEVFATPQHGKGVWAPCLRFHDGKFWIFYPDPDFGIYVMTADKFTGPWTAPHLLLAGKGIIDPTPLWDDDGQAYLLHAWAKSRAGISNLLTLRRMSPDATHMLDTEGKTIIDGNLLPNYRTLEGPKLYKHNGYYYVFAPAGGVETGWQSVFRSRSIAGPYEDKIVMDQGSTPTNGPHQGAWVQTPEGADWFMHFQDKRAYGRVMHLQPMRWKDDWPVIGEEKGDSGVGQPVLQYRNPVAGQRASIVPPTSDEFASSTLGLQWQWNANWDARWYSLTASKGALRLFTQHDPLLQANQNLWATPAILLQKLPAENFTVDTRIKLHAGVDGDRSGLVLYGLNYAWLGVQRADGKLQLRYATCTKADANCKEKVIAAIDLTRPELTLRMVMKPGAVATFSYSVDGKHYTTVGEPFVASMGRWVGAQMGLFSVGTNPVLDQSNYMDVDYFRVTP